MAKVEDEWERNLESEDDLDLLFVTFDPDKITMEAIVAKIKELEFTAELRSGSDKG